MHHFNAIREDMTLGCKPLRRSTDHLSLLLTVPLGTYATSQRTRHPPVSSSSMCALDRDLMRMLAQFFQRPVRVACRYCFENEPMLRDSRTLERHKSQTANGPIDISQPPHLHSADLSL